MAEIPGMPPQPELMGREEMLDQATTPHSMDASDLGGLMAQEIAEHESECGLILDKFRLWDQLWRCEPTDLDGFPKDSIYAKTTTMEVLRDVETVFANHYHSIFGAMPWFMADSFQTREGSEECLADWQDLLEDQTREMKLRSVSQPSLRSVVLHGTNITGTPWEFNYQWNDAGHQYERVITADRPKWEYVDLVAFHREPYALDIADAAWVSEERDVSPDAIRRELAAAKQFQGAIVDEAALEEAMTMTERNIAGNQRQQQMRTDRMYANSGKTKKVHLDVRWGYHPAMPKSPIIWKFLRVNRTHVVAQIPNPFRQGYKPYIKSTYIPLGNSFYGFGLGWMLERSQIENNLFRAVMRNKALLWLMGMYIARGGTVGEDETINPRPGGVVDGSRYGELTPMPNDMTGAPVVQGLEAANNDQMRFASVANSSAQASITGASATEVKDVSMQTNIRNIPTSQHIADTMFLPFLERMVEQDRQFLPEEVVAWKLGDNGHFRAKKILTSNLPDQVKVHMKLAPDPDFVVATLRRLTSFLGEVSTVMQVPEFKQQIMEEGFTMVPILKRISRYFGENPNEVFNPALKQQAQELATAKIQADTAKAKLALELTAHQAENPPPQPEPKPPHD